MICSLLLMKKNIKHRYPTEACYRVNSLGSFMGRRPHGSRPHDLQYQLHIEADVNYYYMVQAWSKLGPSLVQEWSKLGPSFLTVQFHEE